MATGCKNCDEKQRATGDDNALCDKCRLEYLAYCVELAKQEYDKKLKEIEEREQNAN